MATATNAADRIGDLLLREGLISNDQLQKALMQAREKKQRIGYSLIELGYVAEEDLTRMLARQYRLPAVDLNRVQVDQKILKLVPADIALKHLLLPLRRVGRTLTVAMANPTDAGVVDNLKFITRHDIEPVIVGEYTLKKHLEKYYQGQETDDRLAELLDVMEETDVEKLEAEEEELNVAVAASAAEDAPVVKLINGILTDAVLRGASDIHIEPYEKEMRVRYRIDGVLQEIMKPPMKLKAALTSRVKMLSDLNIADRRVPQDRSGEH